MTDAQKTDLIDAYNHAVDSAARALLALDRDDESLLEAEVAGDHKRVRRAMNRHETHSSDHSMSMGVCAGIARTLELLGYAIVIDDEDYAHEIITREDN